MLVQFLNNRNNGDTIGGIHDEEENPNNEPSKTEKSKGISLLMSMLLNASKLRGMN